jgi:cytochrome c553
MRYSIYSVVFLLVFACGSEDGEDEEEVVINEVATDVCASGQQWAGGDEESPLMHPGRECIGCHQDRGEGADLVVAGTVYSESGQSNDCFGAQGVTVEVTDSTGEVFTMTSNEAGNFMLETSSGAEPPFTVRVTSGGQELAMGSEISTGACNSCHTETGANGAPGRITAP